MTNIESINLSAAERDFLVANTPMFLARKLQTNPAVRFIADKVEVSEILDALKISAANEPTTLRESTLPYVLLVALFLKRNMHGLRLATLITPHWHHRWFDYMRTALIQMFRAESYTEIKVPNTVAAAIITRSTSASSYHSYKIGKT